MGRLILPTLAVVLLVASCTATTETSYSEIQVDSIAKAEVDSINWMLKRRNDSLINVAAQQEAKRLDSLDHAKAPPIKIIPTISEKLPPRDYNKDSPKTPELRKKDTTR